MKYVITSRREEAVTIDGLGILPAARLDEESGGLVVTSIELEQDQIYSFEAQRGVKLLHATMPEGVSIRVEV